MLLVAGFGVLTLGIATLAYLIFRRPRTDSLTLRLLFGTVIAVTGLLLDAVVYGATASRYPVLPGPQQGR
ncbi:hypothetical protein G3N18_00960 [Microbacterium sp. 2C]|uniref:hypothetical protein n=1 Tax=Actinomycetes TaxID=1760 RepID=UPI000D55A2A8|nr:MULTISPECIES: hypothetical protein [Actinomycetes]MBG0716663.1 hypothetical protein [Microbacterium paulum]